MCIIQGRLFGAALFLALPASADPVLQVRVDPGEVIARLPMPDGAEICLDWAHSVTGGKVSDCFENRSGQLLLARSYLHDFAAGLGEVAGRGILVSAPEGGYWIEGIDEVMSGNGITIRIGSAQVNHRLQAAGHDVSLSKIAPGTRARIELHPEGSG